MPASPDPLVGRLVRGQGGSAGVFDARQVAPSGLERLVADALAELAPDAVLTVWVDGAGDASHAELGTSGRIDVLATIAHAGATGSTSALVVRSRRA